VQAEKTLMKTFIQDSITKPGY